VAWSNTSKNSSTFTDQAMDSGTFFLLQEISDYLLLESGYRILLQETIDWTATTKNSSTFTNQAKN